MTGLLFSPPASLPPLSTFYFRLWCTEPLAPANGYIHSPNIEWDDLRAQHSSSCNLSVLFSLPYQPYPGFTKLIHTCSLMFIRDYQSWDSVIEDHATGRSEKRTRQAYLWVTQECSDHEAYPQMRQRRPKTATFFIWYGHLMLAFGLHYPSYLSLSMFEVANL